MHKFTRITVATEARVLIVLADVGLVVEAARISYKLRGPNGSFGARVLVGPDLGLVLLHVGLVARLAPIGTVSIALLEL